MCGIVGYSGPRNAIDVVLEGLSRLEYRGYDSSGISFKENDQLKILKKEGKLDNLKKILKESNPVSHHAIGHTRWATHGGVTDFNAHPHGDDKLAVVHNGIIENAQELKKMLQAEKYEFKSETDSEVFFVLLKKYKAQLKDMKKAIAESYLQVKGNSAFVIIDKELNSLYAIKRAAPLVVGENTKEGDVFVSSDPYALIGFADKIYFPEDGVVCEGKFNKEGQRLSFFELEGGPSRRIKIQEKELKFDIATKGNFEHFMLKEIYEQPSLIRNLSHIYRSPLVQNKFLALARKKYAHIHIAACGTAWHAGLVMKNFLEKATQTNVNVELASEFRYREPILQPSDLGIFVSQSGETADTLACQELCAEHKMQTLGIVNVEGSTLFRNCNENLLIYAGQEIGVASTKAFTQQVITGFLLAQALDHKLNDDKTFAELNILADRFEKVLEKAPQIQKIAQAVHTSKGFIFTGRGIDFPIALEGALKLKEIAYVHAEGYAAGELKHGPIALIDQNMVNIAIITPDLADKTLSNAQEVKARKGIIVTIGPENDERAMEISDHYFGLDYASLPHLHPLLTNLVLQLFSYYVAKLKGTDIDKPRNLAKSVTVE